MDNIIDCRGLSCPKPVIITKNKLDSINLGEITTLVDNEVAKHNLQKLANSMGYKSSVEERENLFYVTIVKDEGLIEKKSEEKRLVIIIGKDKLGSGEDKLGIALMKSYMFALSESDIMPECLIFLNSGVKLTTQGSDVIESLQKIEGQGVEIMSCGTCLEFYNLKNKLVIGSVTNMYSIVEKMNNALNTITL